MAEEQAVEALSLSDIGLGAEDHDDTPAPNAGEDDAAAAEPDKSSSDPSSSSSSGGAKGADQTAAAPEVPAVPTVRQPPKSWAKEKHEVWAKMPPEAQEYYETREKQMLDGLEQYKGGHEFASQLRKAFEPFAPSLKASGINEVQAVQTLLNAHYRLTSGTPDQRAAAYKELGRNLGLVEKDPNAPADDPKVKALEERQAKLEQSLTQREQADLNAAKERVAKEVQAFASDPKNPYFDQVSEDIVRLLNTGLALPDAYEKAVWANPVTRAKEIARVQTEEQAKLQAKAKEEAEAARKARSTNVRSADTRKAPTEPLGSMEDTMRETLRKIQSRAH
jgi:hypothetical protein